jgi:lysophospholipase L1-like esterase
VLFFYPGRDEYIALQKGVDYVPDRAALERIAARYGLRIVDMGKQAEWNLSMYREGTHPTEAGNRVMAEILASAVRDTRATRDTREAAP